MTTIPLHKDRGLDPHRTFCPRCKGEGTSVTLGELIEYTLPDGRKLVSNKGQGYKDLRTLGISARDCTRREIEEHEKVPDSQPCKTCQKELDKHAEVVDKGGIYFKCKECRKSGVILGSSSISKMVREEMKIEKGPCGVEFNTCREHSVYEKEENQNGR